MISLFYHGNLGTYEIIQKKIHLDTWHFILSQWIKPWTKVSKLSRTPTSMVCIKSLPEEFNAYIKKVKLK